MTAAEHDRGSPTRKRSVLLALRYYGRQMARLRRFTVSGMLLPALGNTCIYYVAPLGLWRLASPARVNFPSRMTTFASELSGISPRN
jgi:hypothetical protein